MLVDVMVGCDCLVQLVASGVQAVREVCCFVNPTENLPKTGLCVDTENARVQCANTSPFVEYSRTSSDNILSSLQSHLSVLEGLFEYVHICVKANSSLEHLCVSSQNRTCGPFKCPQEHRQRWSHHVNDDGGRTAKDVPSKYLERTSHELGSPSVLGRCCHLVKQVLNTIRVPGASDARK